MIVDTSVIIALSLQERWSDWAARMLSAPGKGRLLMSWVNIAESGMTLNRSNRQAGERLPSLLSAVGIQPLDLDEEVVRVAVDARSRFPLNFGDCFAYAHARVSGESLIAIDRDFLRTDLADIVHPERSR